MAKYRKKSIVINGISVKDALQYAKDNWNYLPKWLSDQYEQGKVIFLNDAIIVTTLEGNMRGEFEDTILCGVKGEIYPIKPDILKMTYDKVVE